MELEQLYEKLKRVEAMLEKAALNTKEVLTVEEAAQYLGLTRGHVHNRLIGGKKPVLKSFQPGGGKRYIRRDDLIDYMLQNGTTTVGEAKLTNLKKAI
ncbi:MAG TPA: helix-turn-helix domain-containing protein [Chitinophagales bacterium]|nr:helix-turn-helix domain-containing protein [Chitinophagales bacterium]